LGRPIRELRPPARIIALGVVIVTTGIAQLWGVDSRRARECPEDPSGGGT
jgi:hypothetical protein